jgi:transposase InsO family protein
MITQVYQESRQTYGCLRITRQLRYDGHRVGKNRVARIKRQAGLYAKARKKFRATTNSRHDFPVAENLLNQNFVANRPNQVWVTDLTYVSTGEGWLYLAAVMDLYSRQIVGWAMDRMMTSRLVIQALRQAVGRRCPPRGLVHHSDRGCQYASHDYQSVLRDYGFISSMSRKGNCYDNACMESFFHTLKTECVYSCSYHTRNQAIQSIFEYIEFFYNRKRLHSFLNYMSPCQFESQNIAA